MDNIRSPRSVCAGGASEYVGMYKVEGPRSMEIPLVESKSNLYNFWQISLLNLGTNIFINESMIRFGRLEAS